MKVVFSSLKYDPSDDPNLEEHVKAGKTASPRRRWPSLWEEGVAGGEMKNERRNGSGGKGKMSTSINRSMAVVVNDDLWISSMAVIHNAGYWEFFLFNSRRYEHRPLNFTKGRRSQRRPLSPCSTTH